jgi:hypothetical protein
VVIAVLRHKHALSSLYVAPIPCAKVAIVTLAYVLATQLWVAGVYGAWISIVAVHGRVIAVARCIVTQIHRAFIPIRAILPCEHTSFVSLAMVIKCAKRVVIAHHRRPEADHLFPDWEAQIFSAKVFIVAI